MGKWKMVRLGDVCDSVSSNIAQKDLNDNEGIYPIYGASGLIKHVNFYRQKNEYVAVIKDGAGIGRTTLLPAQSSVIGTIQALIPRDNINTRYLYFAASSMNLAKYYTGATIPHIYFKDYKSEILPLPPLDVQKKIADVLDKASALIKLRRAQLDKLDLLIKSQFIEMFGDPVLDNMRWGTLSLGELIESIRYGTSTPPNFSNSGFAFIRATNIKNGNVTENDMKYVTAEEARKIKKCKLCGGEIIIVRSGVNSGDTCIVTDKYKGHYAGYDMILVLSKAINSVFLNVLLNTTYMDKVVKPLTRRAAQPHLNSDQVQSLPIINTPIALQNEFAAFVERVEEQKKLLQQSLSQLELNYKALMQKCFRGELF